MHARRTPLRIALALLVLLMPALTGCATLGGALVGSMISRDLGEQPAHVLHDIPRGRRLDLSLHDGRTLRAWWVAAGSPDETAYHTAWRRMPRRLDAAVLPQPLDTVSWITGDTRGRAPILAFEVDALVVGGTAGERARIPYDRLDRVSWPGSEGLTSLALHRLRERGELPLPGRIRVERPTRPERSILSAWADTTIDLADIRVVRMNARGDAARVGAQVGIVMDIGLLIALVFLHRESGPQIQ